MGLQFFQKCENWAIKYEAFSLSIFANIFLGALFVSPSLFGLSLHWFRIASIFVNFFAFFTSVHYCDPNGAFFSILFIFANIFRLIQKSFLNRTNQVPKCLQELYKELFKEYKMSRSDFVLLTHNCRLVSVGPEEFVFREGGFRANRSSLSILISGHLTAWCDGLPLHSVEARQFLDSVEWKSFQFQKQLCNNNNESRMYHFEPKSSANNNFPDVVFAEDNDVDDDERLEEVQVGLQADAESIYLQLCGKNLELIKVKRPDLFYLLDAIVCRDISKKMYTMNDAFEKGLAAQVAHKVRERRNPIVRSLSLDTIDTASHGFVVSENWFSYEQRFRTLKCLHDKNDKMIDEVSLRVTPSPLSAYRNSDVAYMMQNSHPKITGKTGIVPSLKLQAFHLDPESCKFRNPDLIREIDWSNALEHCGVCQFCRPLAEDEVETHQVKKS